MMDAQNKKAILEDIELELNDLIRHDRKNWVKTAKLLLIIERDKLYEVRAASYSGYIRKLAYQNRINASTLWRIKSAAKLFMELSGIEDITLLQEAHISATPEQLEIYKKVRSIVPEKIMDNLRNRMLEGKKVRGELQRLWEIYKPLKKGKTERGRKKADESNVYPENDQAYLPFSDSEIQVNMAIGQQSLRQLNKDLQKIDRFDLSPEDITMANMLNALRSAYWMEYTYQKVPLYRFKLFQKLIIRAPLNHKAYRIDCMALTFSEKSKRQIPDLVAVKIGLSEEALLRIKKDFILNNFCHYAFVAIPDKEKLIAKAKKVLPTYIGILSIKDQLAHTRHAIQTIRLPEEKRVEDRYANAVHRAMLLRSLQWNSIEKPEAF